MKKQKEMRQKPKSLNRRILMFLLLCWVIPIAVFFAFTAISYRKGIMNKAENLMEEELKNMASVTAIRINEAVSLCQKPSYEKTWENAWEKYRTGETNKTDFLRNINSSLKGKFYLDERFNMYAFYLYGAENPDCYGSRVGASYNSYVDEVQNDIKKVIAYDSSYTYVRVYDGRIYIIRNLYTTTGYKRFGTLVVELNRQKVFQDMPSMLDGNMLVLIEEQDGEINFFGTETDKKQTELIAELRNTYDGSSNNKLTRIGEGVYNGYLYQKKCDYYHIGIVVTTRRSELYSSLYQMYEVMFVMLILFLPLISYGVLFLRRQIQQPVRRLVAASRQIEDGEIGALVAGSEMPNQEFDYLMESFNSMSSQVKYLFDSVYNEKLERKDAQIQALQAQIDPHFLNNTLEMMNWQARMSGDIVVSKMIESLGTVLNYRMNRADVKTIHLSEELHCTDAYLYIMTMRFGQRLQIERDIDGDLLYIPVPPLILQPLVENAIVHGVEAVKNGSIRLQVFHDEETVYLQVKNSGKMLTEQDMERIRGILSGDESGISQQGGYTSIGIRNVNKRIKLVYGEAYGLTITCGEDGQTISTITIPYQELKKETRQQEERTKVENELQNRKKTT